MEIDGMNDTFLEYKNLNIQLKEKEELFDKLVIESDELDSKCDHYQSEFSSVEKEMIKKKEEIFLGKDNYVSKRDRVHSRKVFAFAFLVSFISSIIISGFNMSIPMWQLVVNSLVVSMMVGGIEGALFTKKNTKKYTKEYFESEEYRKLKSEFEKIDIEFKTKLNEFNNVISEIQSHSNKMDMVKKEYNDIKYALSRLVSDTFRAMYEAYGFVDEEIQEEPYELKRRNTYARNF